MPARSESRKRFPLLLCVAACALAPLRGANALQEPGTEPEQTFNAAAVRAQMDVVLREHDRVRHGGSAEWETTGVEQGDNDMRSQTPALVNALRTQGQLNADEMHQRALAMYENRATRFTSAGLAAQDLEDDPSDQAPKARVKPKADEAAPTNDRTALRLLSGVLIVIGGAIAWICSKR